MLFVGLLGCCLEGGSLVIEGQPIATLGMDMATTPASPVGSLYSVLREIARLSALPVHSNPAAFQDLVGDRVAGDM